MSSMYAVTVFTRDVPYACIDVITSHGEFGKNLICTSPSYSLGSRLVAKSDVFPTREEAERAVVDRLRVGAETIQETYRTYAAKFGGA